ACKKADDRTAVRQAIEFALEHGAGKHSHEKSRTGLAGYDTWIEFLQQPEPLKKDENCGLGASYNAQCWSECRKRAVAFLQEAKTRLGDDGLAGLFDEAIKHYKAVSAGLKAVAGEFPFTYGDQAAMDKRIADSACRARAVEALKAARAAEASGLQALARIAAALGGKGVESGRTGAPVAGSASAAGKEALLKEAVAAFEHITTKVASHKDWSDGVYPYPQPCVYLVAHLVCMLTAGWKDADFDTLAAVSGASALFAYEPETFMPKYANLMIGMDERIAEATGFGFEWVRFDGVEGAWGVLTESIDSGRPATGWHAEHLVFAGYRDARKPARRKVFAMTDGPEHYARWWTWKEFADWAGKASRGQMGRHGKRVRQAAARKVARRVAADLLTWSDNPPEPCRRRFPKAKFGLAGMAAYADDCADVARFKDWAMCHGINPQWTVRNSSAVYLRRVARDGVFPEKVSTHLASAADAYQGAFAAWHEAYGLLGHGATKRQRRDKSRRQAAADLIRQGIAREKTALAALAEADAAMG
ncbi:MAG: cysteine peptidase family C39 domain-containing protein, partial [Planctomycetota bacterium]